MPPLSRSTGKLLRTVGNKPYASDADHDDDASSGLSEPPDEAEDSFREPDSSDDEVESLPKYQPRVGTTAVRAPPRRKQNGLPNIHTVADRGAQSKDSGKRLRDTQASSGQSGKDQEDREPEWVALSSQSSNKRAKTGYGKTKPNTFKKPASAPTKRERPVPSFKAPRGISDFRITADSSSQVEPSSQQTTFELPRGYDIDAEALDLDSPESETRGGALEPLRAGSSSPLSSAASEVDQEDIEIVNLASSQHPPSGPTSPCPLCGQQVEDSFRETWEYEVAKGKRMTYKSQARFCKAHKARSAKLVWDARGYPIIRWDALLERLKQHNEHIQAVLDGQKQSHYRDKSEERVRSGTSKTTMKTLSTGAGTGGKAGYYGSKGEKSMSDYISQTFSAKLRRLAGADKLVAATGTSGGVSGYVQAVLVPELAVASIMEDADVDVEKARAISAESTEVGDLLNEEDEESIPCALRERRSSVEEFGEV